MDMFLNHGNDDASAWIQRWSHLLPTGGTVLDLACGHGRHVRWFASRGHPVVAVDRSQEALDAIADLTQAPHWSSLRTARGGIRLEGGPLATGPPVSTVWADLENAPWPLLQDGTEATFDGVVVTNYLWRDLLPTIMRSVAVGGVLLYETFAHGNASVGKPSRPDFLLQPGELLQACSMLRVVAYEDGFCTDPPRFVQRIAAVREPAPGDPARNDQQHPARYCL